MKLSEIVLTEWQDVPPNIFAIPPIGDAIFVDNLYTSNNEFRVYEKDYGNRLDFFVVDDTEKPIAYSIVKLIQSKLGQTKNVVCLTPKEGIISALYEFIVNHRKLYLINDSHLTTDGAKLWLSLIKSYTVKCCIYDSLDGVEYDISDAGKKTTEDGHTVIAPENDRGYVPGEIHTHSQKQQRFFYLLTPSSPSQTEIHNKRKQLSESTQYTGPLIPLFYPYIKFGPAMDQD